VFFDADAVNKANLVPVHLSRHIQFVVLQFVRIIVDSFAVGAYKLLHAQIDNMCQTAVDIVSSSINQITKQKTYLILCTRHGKSFLYFVLYNCENSCSIVLLLAALSHVTCPI